MIDHLELIGRRRNIEVAHSDALDLKMRDAEASKTDLVVTLKEVGYNLGHMAQHIGEIEEKMLWESELRVGHSPSIPPIDALMKIPCRPDEETIARALAEQR